MAPKSKRLRPIVDIAKARENEAAKALGQVQEALTMHQQQLQEMQVYRQEYAASLSSGSLNASQLQGRHQFLNQLNNTIDQLQKQIEKDKELLEQSRLQWLEKHTRTEALGKAVSRSKEKEVFEENRREQKENDDRPQRRH